MTNPPPERRRLDANAAIGPLADLFTVDMATATVICGGCGGTAALAAHMLYADAPALVVRCPGCAGVVLRFANTGGRLRLDLAGARLITIPLPAEAPEPG